MRPPPKDLVERYDDLIAEYDHLIDVSGWGLFVLAAIPVLLFLGLAGLAAWAAGHRAGWW